MSQAYVGYFQCVCSRNNWDELPPSMYYKKFHKKCFQARRSLGYAHQCYNRRLDKRDSLT